MLENILYIEKNNMYYPVNRRVLLNSIQQCKVVSATLKRTNYDGQSIQRRGLSIYSQHAPHQVLFLDKNGISKMPSPYVDYERPAFQQQKMLFSTIISPSSTTKNLDV